MYLYREVCKYIYAYRHLYINVYVCILDSHIVFAGVQILVI